MDYTVLDELAYRIFGNFFYKNKEKFLALKVKIRKSHISMSVDQYLASACMYSIIAGLIGGIFGAFLGLKTFGNPIYRLIHFLNSATNAGFGRRLFIFTWNFKHPFIVLWSVFWPFLAWHISFLIFRQISDKLV